MINESTQKNTIQKIVSDTIFEKSRHYKELLLYFHNCSLEGIIPTEVDIAQNVFQKDNSFDPTTDTLVRVYVHKLRKSWNNIIRARENMINSEPKFPRDDTKFNSLNMIDSRKTFGLNLSSKIGFIFQS